MEATEEIEDVDVNNDNNDNEFSIDSEPMNFGGSHIGNEERETEETEEETSGEELPSPEELGVDMTDSNNPDFD